MQQLRRDRTRLNRSIARLDGRTTLYFKSILYERRTQSLPPLSWRLAMDLKSRNLDSFSGAGAARDTMSILSVTSALSGLSHSSSATTAAAISGDNLSYGDGTNRTLDELIETENSFVHKLELLDTEFRRRLQATLNVKCAKPLLSAAFIDEVFSFVDEIRDHNSNLLTDFKRILLFPQSVVCQPHCSSVSCSCWCRSTRARLLEAAPSCARPPTNVQCRTHRLVL